MSSNINLLDFNTKIVTKNQFRGKKPLRFISIFLLFGVSAASIIFFLLVALSPIPQLKKERADAASQLSASHEDVVKLLLINDRISTIKTFINARPNFSDVISLVQKGLAPDVSIDTISIKDNSILLTLSSKSLLSLDNAINNMTKSDGAASQFTNIQLKNFSRDEGTDRFEMNVLLQRS